MGDDRGDRAAAGASIAAAFALWRYIDEPEPGATSRWARLTVRKRALARIGLALFFFVCLGVVAALLEYFLGEHAFDSPFGKLVFRLAFGIGGFGGVYIFICGVVSAVVGRPWEQIGSVGRISALVLLTPIVTTLMFVAVFFPGPLVHMLASAEWVKSLSPPYAEIRRHVVVMHEIEENCRKSDVLDCSCQRRDDILREVAAIDAVVSAHPAQASFEVLVPLHDNVSQSYNLDFVHMRASLTDDCGQR